MADAARQMPTDELVREKYDLNEKAIRDGGLSDSERIKDDVLNRELAQRPVTERALAGAIESVRRSMGAQSTGLLDAVKRPRLPATYQCFVCNGSGITDSSWNSGTCPICSGMGKIKVPKGNPQGNGDVSISINGDSERPVSSESDKPFNFSPKTAKAIDWPTTVEGNVEGGQAAYYKIQAKAGDQITFTIYAQNQENGTGVECTFALQDEEAGNLDSTILYVRATGDDYDRETLISAIDEDGTYLFRFRSEGDGSVDFKIKVK